MNTSTEEFMKMSQGLEGFKIILYNSKFHCGERTHTKLGNRSIYKYIPKNENTIRCKDFLQENSNPLI